VYEYLAAGLHMVSSKGLPVAARLCRQDPRLGNLVTYPHLEVTPEMVAAQEKTDVQRDRLERVQHARRANAYRATLAPFND
jgi:hypothetical protein